MPRAKQPEAGVRTPYKARYGVDIGPCTGLDLSHDPSTIADTALRQAINARVHDGIVLSRGGQSETETGMSGCIQGLIDIEGTGVRMVLATNEDPGPGILTEPPAAIAMLDENLRKNPADATNFVLVDGDPFSEHPRPANASGNAFQDTLTRYAYTWWNGSIIFQDLDSDKIFKLLLPEDGIDAEDIGREELFQAVVPGEEDPFIVSSFALLPQIGNVNGPLPLYMGTVDGGVVAHINGQLTRLLADATFSSRVTVFTYNNRLYAAGTQKVMYQSNGWVDGGTGGGTAWTDITPLPTVTDFRPMAGIEALGFGWIGGWDNDITQAYPNDSGFILKVNDASGTPVITVGLNGVGGGDALLSVDDFAIGVGGKLYVAYRQAGPASFFGNYGTFNGTGISNKGGWGEANAMCYRLQGTANKIYASGWGSDADTSIVVWDGSTETTIVKWTAGDPSPWDMVLF